MVNISYMDGSNDDAFQVWFHHEVKAKNTSKIRTQDLGQTI